jgi:tripartite-type tricarboxylate transporter receptor subunit TctC
MWGLNGFRKAIRGAMPALLALGSSLVFLHASTAQSDYPSKPIKMIVPFPAGGPPDAIARVLGQHLHNRVGQPVIIENRPGGGTTIGTRAALSANADGYTLLFTGNNLCYFPVLYPKLDFDPVKSLAAVASVVSYSHVIAVAPGVPAKSIGELIAHTNANPGKLIFGYAPGTPPQILGEAFRQATATDIAFVPYRGGDRARADLLGGRIHINIAPVAILLPLIREGKIRPLAFTGPQRSPDLPDVPTMVESGLPEVGFNPDAWHGLMAPATTSWAVIERLNAAINSSLQSPEMTAALATLGIQPMVTTPHEFATFLSGEMQKWPQRLRLAGVQAE